MNHFSHKFRPAILTIATAAAAWLSGGDNTAKAQLDVGLKMDKQAFMTHEPVSGILTLTNRSGSDMILDGRNGGSWLDFKVTDPRSQMISPNRGAVRKAPILLKSGVPLEIRVNVSSLYPMGATGRYAVKAQIYFPPIDRFFESNRVTLSVVEGKRMWSQIVGVPQGFVGAGSYRQFELLTFFQGARERALYFRLTDVKSQVVRRTFTLGQYVAAEKPQSVVDSKNRLHLLHLAGPQSWFYTVIDPAGAVEKREGFRATRNGSKPQLIVNSVTGEVAVEGGISQTEDSIPYKEREFRKASERPPGLPGAGYQSSVR